MLSASPTAQVIQGALFITGTESADVIDVTVRPFRTPRGQVPLVRVSGIPRWFVGTRFSTVVVDARGGDDLVSINDGGRPLLPSWLDGGAGNDTLRGGAADDVLIGGPGDDQIVSRGGSGLIDGGPGRDVIDGVPDPEPAPPEPTATPEPAPVPVPTPTASPSTPTVSPSTPVAPSTPPASPSTPTVPTNPTTAPPVAMPTTPPAPLDQELQTIVDRTNQARAEAGLAALAVDPKLQEAARIQATNMARIGRLAHELPETSTPTLSDRAEAAGYRFSRLGENIAYNYFTADQAVDGWLGSEGHRRNILDDGYTQIGVAIAFNGAGRPYYVQVFGTPSRA